MEADQLSVELTQKNDLLKKFSSKCNNLEIELVRLQAMHAGHTEDSLEEHHESDRSGGASQGMFSPQKSGSAKKGVSSKLKSFFTNKFKKPNKGT